MKDSSLQLVPAAAGGVGAGGLGLGVGFGLGVGLGLGVGSGPGVGAGTLKRPRLCHCMSFTRRKDWMRGVAAPQSFQCL